MSESGEAGGGPWRWLRRTLLQGVAVVLPLWLVLWLATRAVEAAGGLVSPVSGWLPESIAHPRLLSFGALVALCLAAGLLAKVPLARAAGRAVQARLLARLPGYRVLRSISHQIGEFQSEEDFKPALLETADGLVPGFVVENPPGECCTLFLPTAPTPMVGELRIVRKERVRLLDVPFSTLVSCVGHWGAGAVALAAAARPGTLADHSPPAGQAPPLADGEAK